MTNVHHTNNWATQRRDMVMQQLIARGITNSRVLEVMKTIPREYFLPPSIQHLAYQDHPIAIGLGQTISQPYIVARMTELLDLHASHQVLEIGTGSGYQSAILASLSSKVISMERHDHLLERAKQHMALLQIENIQYILGDGTMGSPAHAPFHRILVTAAGPAIPQALCEQLTDGGKLVMPVGDMNRQTLHCLQRRGHKKHITHSTSCRFVKLIGQQAWPESTIE